MMMAKKKIHSATTDTNNAPLVFTARITGLLYLVIIVCGISSEIFVRMRLIVPGDAAKTAANILAFPLLFRTGFTADAIMLFCDVAVAVLFYVLFKPVNKTLAIMAAAFRLIQAAVLGANLLNYHAALLVLGGSDYGNFLFDNQRHGLMMLFLDLHRHGYDLGLLFFAVSNFILGYLITRSTLFPAIFGYALSLAAAVYLAGSYCRFVLPQYVAFLQPAYFIPFIAEFSFCLWLLIKGVSVGKQETNAPGY